METWVTSDEIKLPNYLNKYRLFNCKATKDKIKGRASGGLMILTSNFIKNVKVVDCNKYYIFIELSLKNEIIIIGNIYWPPFQI